MCGCVNELLGRPIIQGKKHDLDIALVVRIRTLHVLLIPHVNSIIPKAQINLVIKRKIFFNFGGGELVFAILLRVIVLSS